MFHVYKMLKKYLLIKFSVI